MLLPADPAARSSPNVVAKNSARADLRAQSRVLSRIIHSKRIATGGQIASMGLTVRRRGGRPARHSAPTHAPRLSIIETRGRDVKIRLRDADAPTRRGRPVGVAGAQVFIARADDPVSVRPMKWSRLLHTTRTLLTITLPTEYPAGSKVWLSAAWIGTRGDASPMSDSAVATIPHHATAPAQMNCRAA